MSEDPTYPRGKLNDDDEGVLKMRVSTVPSKRTLILDFGKPIVWLGMGKVEVEQLAKLLLERAEEMIDDPRHKIIRGPANEKAPVVVELSARTVELLSVLGDPKDVLAELADHAQQGVYRPGSWERGWLVPVFGDAFTSKLEQDPDAPYFQRPRRAQ